ncbi:hypothetical protein BC829DRAFT_390352 [Chytridium lagenaria]|nr:hypothetical protein BC829DRAFT_390352 [Chytridium lagenaria]
MVAKAKSLKTKADAAVVDGLLDESNFIKANKDRLEAILGGKSDGGSVILTKSETLALLEEQFGNIRSALSTEAATFAAEHSASHDAESEKKLKSFAEKFVTALKYSADVVARPDYALASAGAYVVGALTSSSLKVDNPSWVGKMFGLKKPRGYGPSLALSPYTLPGYCWSMEGSSAGILLAMHRFDPYATDVQTFAVRSEAVKFMKNSGRMPSVAVLRVLSNWGNGEYTCLYRFRVHGSE